MRVVVTGGGGFLGQLLAREILRRGGLRKPGDDSQGSKVAKVTELVIGDIVEPSRWLFDKDAFPNVAVAVRLGDVSGSSYCDSLLATVCGHASASDVPISIFHLGGVMSGTGEANFELAMNVNLQGTLNMLEAARKYHAATSVRPSFVFTSSMATIGSGHPADWVGQRDVISDSTKAAPHTTYGMTKACGELFLSDYNRRGFIDGRGVRLPTVVVRAGTPNAATTSCFSAVVREPLRGDDVTLPIGPDVLHAVTGYRSVIEGILRVHDAPKDKADELLGYDRTVFLPSRPASLATLADAMRNAVTPESAKHLGGIAYDVENALSRIVGSFPATLDADRALKLGISPAPDLDEMVRQYCEDFPSDLAPGVALTPRKNV